MATETIGTLDYNEIVFPKLGIDLHVNSTAFSIGGLDIQWYGILITLGLVLAMIYAFTQVKKYGLNPDRVLDCIIGGIIGGVFTATEGSVVAVVYSLLLSLFGYKSIKLKEIPKILRESAEMTGIIIFLIGVSSIMSWVMAFTNIPSLVSSALLSISSNRYVILFLINIILLVVGTFMDMTPACLIFTPIFLPVCQALGMNTIHFGIMLIFNLCIGTITPPVGTTLFVGVKVGGVKIETVFKQLITYFAAIFAVLMLVTYVPQISLALPSLMGYVK